MSICLVRAVVKDNEYTKSKQIFQQFAKGIGRELDEKLKNNI